MAEHFDLLIRGGTLVDGTGSPGRRGDLAIRGGRITALGEVHGSADRTIDADGGIVAPGLVDIHTHYDAPVFWDRMLTISPWHGVTSVVVGNCGFGIAPTQPQHRELVLRRRAVVVNGVVIREDGEDRVDPAGALPGRVLRGGPCP